MNYAKAAELLPWLINRTLSGEEESGVRQQLRESEELRRELRETVEAARGLGEPPSVEALVDFASGRPTAEAELIAGLVETSPEWAEQVKLARLSFALQDDSVAVLGGRHQRRWLPSTVPGYWRPMAIAASLAAMIGLSGWLAGWHPGSSTGTTTMVSTPWLTDKPQPGETQAPPRSALPQPNVTVLDLVASSFIRRDGAGEMRQSVRLAELGSSLVLILASDSDRVFDRYEIELVGPGGVSSTPEVMRTPQHDYTLLVPRSLLVPGDYTIHVYGHTGSGHTGSGHTGSEHGTARREPLESYELRVEP